MVFEKVSNILANQFDIDESEISMDTNLIEDLSADSLDFVYSQVKNLRKKLVTVGADVELKAVYGFGYKFCESE